MTGALLAAAALAASAGASCRWNWWRAKRRGLPVLMYHQIGEPPPGARLKKLWVRERNFRAQLKYLLRNGFTPVLFSELESFSDRAATAPERPVLITFDDGYADNYELAFPALRELGMKANIFLVVGAIGRHNFFSDVSIAPWTRMLTWERVLEMQGSGLVEFGSHTMGHRDLASLSPEETRWELTESKLRLEGRLGRRVGALAYPYGSGAYDPLVRALALEAGYGLDFGIRQGISAWPWDPVSGPLMRLLIRGDDYAWDFHLNMTRGKARL